MLKNEFANEFVARLNGKVSDEELRTILVELQMFVDDYRIDKQKFELAIYEEFPMAYKTYMVTKKIEGRSSGTLELYKMCLEDLFRTVCKPLEDISANDIRMYLFSIQKQRKISDRTLDSRRLILNGFFTWCAQEGYIQKNPCTSIHPIKYEAKPREPLSDIQMELLRDACVTLKEKAIIETLYATGCRCSELCGLKWEDINMTTREVHLFGKGKKHRMSYLNARAEVALKRYLDSRDDMEPWVFVSDNRPHKKMANAGIEKIVKSLGIRAGIENVFPHRIRHTFATDALSHGMDIAELQKLMGHEKIDTTTIYAKINQMAVAYSHKRSII